MEIELKEAFNIFDKESTGRIALKDTWIILRSLGKNPTEAELADILNEHPDSENNYMDFPTFLNYIRRNLQDTDTEEELRERCKVYDREKNGLISFADLRWVLLNLGEKLTEEEVKEMLKETRTDTFSDQGYIRYLDFISLMANIE